MHGSALRKVPIATGIRQDRRRYRRVPYSAPAKCMWLNGHEFVAHTRDIGPGGIAIITDEAFRLNQELIVYIEDLGRFSGTVARPIEYGFAIATKLVPRKRDKVADQLTWLISRQALGLREDRAQRRIQGHGAVIVTYDSVASQCDVIDVSILGVALRSPGPRPPVGAHVKVGQNEGVCARHLERGFAVEFRKPHAIS